MDTDCEGDKKRSSLLLRCLVCVKFCFVNQSTFVGVAVLGVSFVV